MLEYASKNTNYKKISDLEGVCCGLIGGNVRKYYKALLMGVVSTALVACSTNSSTYDSHNGSRVYDHEVNGEHDNFKSDQPRELKGTLFDRYLHDGYARLAKREDYEHDFDDVEKFQNRSLRAAEGQLVSPERLSARDLPEYSIGELSLARARLEDAFYAGASLKMPEIAARAQVMFDCWMEQQEENIQQHDIDECKAAFTAAMAQLESKSKVIQPTSPAYTHSHDREHTHGSDSCVDHTHEAVQAVVAAPPSTSKPESPVTAYRGPYIIFFELDQADITSAARGVLDTVVADAHDMKPRRVVLTAHTDTSGTRSHNEALSQRRAQTAARALRAEGVEVSEMRTSHYGESRPRINTKDGVRHAGNRRVEIDFEW